MEVYSSCQTGKLWGIIHILLCTSQLFFFPLKQWPHEVRHLGCSMDPFSFVIIISLLLLGNDYSNGPCIWHIHSLVYPGFFFSMMLPLISSLQHLFFIDLPSSLSVLRHFAHHLLKHFYNSYFKVLSVSINVSWLCCVFSCNLKLS